MAKFKVRVNPKEGVPVQEHEIQGEFVQVISETLLIYSGAAANAASVVFAAPIAKLISVERVLE